MLLPMRPLMLVPVVRLIPRITVMVVHTRWNSVKKFHDDARKAGIVPAIVAIAARKPNWEYSDTRKLVQAERPVKNPGTKRFVKAGYLAVSAHYPTPDAVHRVSEGTFGSTGLIFGDHVLIFRTKTFTCDILRSLRMKYPSKRFPNYLHFRENKFSFCQKSIVVELIDVHNRSTDFLRQRKEEESDREHEEEACVGRGCFSS